MFSSCFILMVYGLFSIILQFLVLIMALNKILPFSCFDAIKEKYIKMEYSIYFVIAISRSILTIFYNAIIQHFVKVRKVTTFNKIIIMFFIIFTLLIGMLVTEKYILFLIIDSQYEENIIYIVIQSMNDFTFLIFLVIQLHRLVSYTNSMKKFHLFLNTYRQTPRSRNIKKYLPPQDPIFEEYSYFEKSQIGSIIKKSDYLSSHYSI